MAGSVPVTRRPLIGLEKGMADGRAHRAGDAGEDRREREQHLEDAGLVTGRLDDERALEMKGDRADEEQRKAAKTGPHRPEPEKRAAG